jgi:hypothetical protein
MLNARLSVFFSKIVIVGSMPRSRLRLILIPLEKEFSFTGNDSILNQKNHICPGTGISTQLDALVRSKI